jgi:hypothetical protein
MAAQGPLAVEPQDLPAMMGLPAPRETRLGTHTTL